MKTYFNKFKTFLQILRDFLPAALPVGMTEFNQWSNSLVMTYGFPDNASTKFALATMILHAGSTEAYKCRRYFALTLRKSMSNQVAASVMNELKRVQEAEREAERKAEEFKNSPKGRAIAAFNAAKPHDVAEVLEAAENAVESNEQKWS